MKKSVGFVLGLWVVVVVVFLIATRYDYSVTLMLPDNQQETKKIRYNDTVDFLGYENEDYEVESWYYDAEFKKPFNLKENIKGNIVLYPKLVSKIKYRVFLDAYDGKINDELQLEVRRFEVIGILPFNIEKEGYKLEGFYRDSLYQIPFNLETDQVLENLHLYAKWEANKYLVKFLDADDKLLSEVTTEYGKEALAPEVPIKENYEFIRWDKDIDYITSNVTTRPIYQIKRFNLYYDEKHKEVSYDSILELETPIKEGHKFLGWYYNDDLLGEQKISSQYRMKNTDLSVHSKWEKETYSVSFFKQGKNISTQEVKYLEDAKPLTNDDINIPGYKFLRYDQLLNKITKDTEINLIYEEVKHKLTFDDEGKTINENVREFDAIIFPSIEKEGHQFLGWYYVDQEGNEKESPIIMPENDLILKAKWKVNQYTIRFHIENEEDIIQVVKYGRLPDIPTVEEGYSIEWNEEIKRVTEDKVYYGVKTTRKYELVLIIDNINDITINISRGSVLNLNSYIKERPNYIFLGWKDENDQDFTETVMPGRPLKLYAKWQAHFKLYIDDVSVTSSGIFEGDPISNYLEEGKLKEGYDFINYFLDTDFTNVAPNYTTMPNREIRLYSKFIRHVKTVEFISDNVVIDKQSILYGEDATPPAVTNVPEGYKFVKWDRSFTNIKENLIIHAVFEREQYLFESYYYENLDNEGNGLSEKTLILSQTIEYGKGIVLSHPDKDGYKFSGWYLEDGTLLTRNATYTMPAHNLMITARYIPNTYYSVDFNMSPLGIISISVEQGKKVNRPIDPIRDGYTFLGWYTTEARNNLWDFENELITENTTIYAKWQVNQYQVKFLDYKQEVIGEVQTINYSEGAVEPHVPERIGYRFIGWDKSFDHIKENTNITALYSIREYSISYQTDFGTHSNPTKTTIENTIELKPAIKQGYTFMGWYSSLVDGNKLEKLENVAKDTTIYAKYSANQYLVTFDSNGGNAIEGKLLTYNQPFGNLEAPKKVGYTFIGWFLGEERISNHQLFKTPQTIELIANWEINTYLVSFDMGDSKEEIYVTYGNKVTAIIPQKQYYEFIEWLLEDGEKFDFDTPISKNTSLIASFRKLEFTLDYNIDETTTHQNKLTTFNADTNYQLLPATKKGYRFIKWVNQDDEDITYISKQNKDLILTPVFEQETYQITYQSNEQGFTHNNQKVTYQYNESYQLLPASLKGYQFIGWFLTDAKIDNIEGYAQDLILFARFSKESFTITYSSSESDFENPNDTKVTYQMGEVYRLLDAKKRGYQFIGWQYKTELIETLDGLAENIHLKALFQIETYLIDYVVDNLTILPAKISTYTVKSNENLGIAVKEGYLFTGWYLDNLLTQPFSSFSNHSGVLKLYPSFKIVNYKITYDMQTGEVNNKDNILEFNANTDFKFLDAKKEYHTFIGWQDESGASIKNVREIGYRNVKMTPVFERNQDSKVITYDLKGISISKNPSPIAFMIDQSIDLLAPIGAGYEFLGWYLEETPGTDSVAVTNTKDFEDDITLYAQWSTVPLKFTISYQTETSQVIDTTEHNYDATLSIANLTQPTADVTAGERTKTFIGWYLDEAKTIPFEFKNMPAQDITLYAKWNQVYYVEFVTGIDGYEIAAVSKKSEDLMSLTTPTRTGLTFMGYYLDQAFTLEFTDSNMPNKDLVLYLRFEKTKITITYVTNIEGYENIVDSTGEQGVEIPYSPEREGLDNGYMILEGWYTAENFTGKVNFETYKLGSTNLTLYARWTNPPTKPVITVDYNNGEDNFFPVLDWKQNYDLTSLKVPTKEGYTFKHYEVYDSEGKLVSRQNSLEIIDNYLIIAAYDVNQVIITIMDNLELSKRITVNYGTNLLDAFSVTSNKITKAGHELKALYNDMTLESLYDTTSIIKESMTLYAEFEKALYQVTFDTSLGTGMQTRFLRYNDRLNVSENEYSRRDGYRITGFEVSGQLINLETYQIKNHTTIKVIWTKVSYQFILIDTGVETIKNYMYGELLERPPMYDFDSSKGYFAGWFIDPTFTQSYIFDRYMEEGTIRIYAKWVEKIDVEYYLFEEGIFHLILNQQKNSNNKATQPNMDRYGYEFVNWYTNQNMTSVYDFNTNLDGNEPVKLYGKWNAIKHTVTLNVEGSEAKVITRGYSQLLSLPMPEKEGHLFKYWIDENAEIFTRTHMPHYNVTLTAVFEAMTYILRLEANTGVFKTSETVNGVDIMVERQVLTITVPYEQKLKDIFDKIRISKYAYLFENWYENHSVFLEEKMPGRNVTLRATYKMHFTPGLIFVLNQAQGEDVYYVTGYVGTEVNILIPDFMYKDDGTEVKVTNISDNAFAKNRLFEIVTIGKNIQTIGQSAFKNLNKLQEIIIAPNSNLRVIREGAFQGASQLSEFNFPQTIERIENFAFNNTRLTKLLFTDDGALTEIGNSAFLNSRLNEVTLPQKFRLLGNNVFQNNNIIEFVMPKSVTTIGTNLLTGNRNITFMQVPNNYQIRYYFGNTSSNVPNSLSRIKVTNNNQTGIVVEGFALRLKAEIVELDPTIKDIKADAFREMPNLKTINTNYIEQIGNYAFYNIPNLREINLDALKILGNYTFAYSRLLSEVGDLKKIENIGEYALRNTQIEKLDLVSAKVIGIRALNSMLSLKEVHIYNGIQTIGTSILAGSSNIEKLTIPGRYRLLTIFGSTSAIPARLKEVVIADGSTTIIASFAESASNIESVIVPSTVANIETRAFYNATRLSQIDLSQTKITTLTRDVFLGTRALTQIKLPSTVHTIGRAAFYNSGIQNFEFTNVMHTIDLDAFRYSSVSKIELPATIKTVGTNAFSNMLQLEEVIIPATFIPSSSTLFSSSINVRRLTLPGTTKITGFGFTNTPRLEYLEASAGTTQIASEWALASRALELYIPETVTTIGTSAFKNMKQLKNLDLSLTKITSIPTSMLEETSAIREVRLPNTVLIIGSYAFRHSAMSKFVFPNQLEEIKNHAFRGTNLERVILPDSVKIIRDSAFEYMSSLREVKLPYNVTVYNNSSTYPYTYLFNRGYNIEKVTVPGKYSLETLYLHHTTKLTVVEIASGSTEIVDNFMNASSISNYRRATQIIIPSSITKIGNNAFNGVTNLEKVVVREGLTSIGTSAFSGTSIREFDFVSTIRTIGASAFSNTPIEKAILPELMTSVGNSVFANTPNLKEAYLPNATTMGTNIYQNSGLEKLELPGNKTTLISLGLAGGQLREVIITEGSTSVVSSFMYQSTNANAFSQLISVTIPETVTNINPSAFVSFKGTTINLPSKLREIGATAFQNSNIETITYIKDGEVIYNTLPETITKIANKAFDNTKLRELNIPNVSITIETQAFINMANLTKINIPEKAILPSSSINMFTASFANNNEKTLIIDGQRTLSQLAVPTTVTTLNLIITEGTASIPASFASGYTGIISLILPESLATIGGSAFANTRIESVTIPSRVNMIGSLAFSNNPQMSKFIMKNGGIIVGLTILEGNTSLVELTVSGHAKLSQYASTLSTVQSLTTVNIAEGSNYVIEDFAYQYQYLNKVGLPETVKQIQARAFSETGVTTINLDYVTNYSNEAFKNSRIREVNITSAVVSVGTEAFSDNPNLLKVKIDSGYMGAGNQMFKGSNYINDFTIPGNMALESLGISKEKHTQISTVNIAEGTKNIVIGFLDGYVNVERINMPTSVKSIGANAFRGTSIERITVKENVEIIGKEAFNTVTLKNITLELTKVESISSQAFNDAVERIMVKQGMKEIYEEFMPVSLHDKLVEVE